MTPKDAADRLFNRIMTAYESGARDTAQFFAPMARQASGMVDSLAADARYPIGLIDLATSDSTGTLAPAAPIATASGTMTRGVGRNLARPPTTAWTDGIRAGAGVAAAGAGLSARLR